MKKPNRLSDVIPEYLTDGGIFTALNALNVPWKNDIGGDVLDIEYMGNISGSKRISPLLAKMLGDNTELSDENISSLADVIYKINITNWNKLYTTLSLEYNPISNYDMTETETASGTNSETRLNTGTQTTTATGTETNKHTGTREITSENSANGTISGTTASNIFGFNSSTSVGDSDGETSATTSNSATGDETRTDNLTDTRTDDLTNQRTDNLTETENGSNSSSRTLTRSGNIGVTTSQQMIQSERDLWLWNFFYTVVFPDADRVLTIASY